MKPSSLLREAKYEAHISTIEAEGGRGRKWECHSNENEQSTDCSFRLLTNPVRRHRVCQIIQRLNLKQKGMRALRSAFRTNRGISPTAAHSLTRSASTTKGCCEVDLGLCPYLASPSSKPHDLLKKVDQGDDKPMSIKHHC